VTCAPKRRAPSVLKSVSKGLGHHFLFRRNYGSADKAPLRYKNAGFLLLKSLRARGDADSQNQCVDQRTAVG
jgi:hypothetical protein